MDTAYSPTVAAPAGHDMAAEASVEERLERSQVVYFPRAPFALPHGDDLQFLLAQKLGTASKNISFDPNTGKAHGFQRCTTAEAARLRDLLAAFSQNVTGWLTDALPRYSHAWLLDRVSFRPVEEATRRLRRKARNDLLHVDAFPSRPTHGQCILRCFANINPREPRVWVTADSFASLLKRYGREVGLPVRDGLTWDRRVREWLLRVCRPSHTRRAAYDAFMLRFHDFLKANKEFQKTCGKRYWAFPPGSVWLVFTDAVSHAALRGRFALEHSYFVPPEALLRPEDSPAALLQRACGLPVLQAGLPARPGPAAEGTARAENSTAFEGPNPSVLRLRRARPSDRSGKENQA